MKMKNIFPGAVSPFFLCSCVNTKLTNEVWIPRGQVFYERVIDFDAKKDTLYRKILTQGAKAMLSADADGTLSPGTINFINQDDAKSKATIDSFISDPNEPGQIGDYFPRDADITHKTPLNKYLSRSEYFRYTDMRPLFQAITIPFKLWFKQGSTVPSMASAAFSVGIAYGYQFKKYSYTKFYYPQKDGSFKTGNGHTSNWNLTPGIFLAPTVIALDSSNTNGKVSPAAANSVIGVTFGGFIVAGYNNFNLGLAMGFDNAFGSVDKAWIYNGKPWIGLMVGIELFK